MLNGQDVHFLDVVGLLDDPDVVLRNGLEANRVHLELVMMLTELQSLPSSVATDYLASTIRSMDFDFDGMRRHLSKKLRVLDVVCGSMPTEFDGHGNLLRTIMAQTERIERLLARRGDDACGERTIAPSGGIDPTAYYDYVQVARILGVSESTVYRRRVDGRLQAVKIGRRVKFLGQHLLSIQDGERADVHVLQVSQQ